MKMKKFIAVLLCVVSVLSSGINSSAYTTRWTGHYPMGNGKAVCYYSSKSSYLWIGDSRMVQMYGYSGKDSVVACWGASYNTTCTSSSLQIDNKSRFKQIKKIVKKLIKKFGVANVVLVPSINNYPSSRYTDYALRNYMGSYKRIKKISKKVYIITPSLIKKYGGNTCKPFNKKIKKKVMKYVPVKFKAKHYNLRLGDRVHYSHEGLKYMRKKVHNATNGDKKEPGVKIPSYSHMAHVFR